jgi:hypothetical protein
MDDLTKDLQSQIDAFNNWRSNLLSLAGRVPAELLQQLTDLGPSAAAQIAALASASGPELANYVSLWQQSQDQISTAIGDAIPDKNEFQTQITTLVGQIATMMGQISDLLAHKPKALTPDDMIAGIKDQKGQLTDFNQTLDALRKKKIPEQLIEQLAALGPDALPELQALNSMTTTQLNEYVGIWKSMNAQIDAESTKMMKGQIAAWKQHGADIAVGIISGIESEQEALLKFFRKLFMNLLTEARKETKSHSPSKVFEALGVDLVDGLANGLATGRGMRMPLPGLGNSFANGGGYNRGNNAPIQMNIHAHQDESLMSTMERAAFRLRTRRP